MEEDDILLEASDVKLEHNITIDNLELVRNFERKMLFNHTEIIIYRIILRNYVFIWDVIYIINSELNWLDQNIIFL